MYLPAPSAPWDVSACPQCPQAMHAMCAHAAHVRENTNLIMIGYLNHSPQLEVQYSNSKVLLLVCLQLIHQVKLKL